MLKTLLQGGFSMTIVQGWVMQDQNILIQQPSHVNTLIMQSSVSDNNKAYTELDSY